MDERRRTNDEGVPFGEGSQGLTITTEHWERMRADVESRSPEEGCGLLAGLGGEVLEVIPVPNALHSPVRYRMDPRDQWRAFQTIEQSGWELLGIYHSHPNGPEVPSETDVAEAFYPEAAYLIWSKRTGTWRCRAFHIERGQVRPIAISIKSRE